MSSVIDCQQIEYKGGIKIWEGETVYEHRGHGWHARTGGMPVVSIYVTTLRDSLDVLTMQYATYKRLSNVYKGGLRHLYSKQGGEEYACSPVLPGRVVIDD